jgi:hypothetical protein
MVASTLDIARELEAAFCAGPAASRRRLRSLYADQVMLIHVPALPSDGVVVGQSLAAGTEKEADAIGAVMTDQHYSGIEISVDGHEITIRAQMTGTLTSGVPVTLPIEMHCTTGDGRIVALKHVFADGAMSAWAEVAVAGGLRRPDA